MIADATARLLHDRIAREWSDKGKVIRGGFEAMLVTLIPKDTPAAAIHQLRFAYMGGAQHLWASMFAMLDPDAEPTGDDVRRMGLIHVELEQWASEAKALVLSPTQGSA